MRSWLCVVALVGCYNPTIKTGVRCGEGDVCPGGQVCIAGYCDGTIDASVVDQDSSTPASDASIDAMMMIDAPPAAAAPQFVAFSLVNAAGTSATVQVPAGTAAGDLLLAHVSADAATIATVDVPAGWTLVQERDGVENPHYGGVFYRRAMTGTTSYTWTFPNDYGAVYLMAFRNINATPIDASDAAISASAVTPTAPSITTTRANTLLVVMLTQDLSNGPFTPIANMTQVYSTFTDELMVLAAHAPVAAAGATGPRTAATTDAGPTIGFSVALAPL